MSVISRIRILRVIKGCNDYLISTNTSSAKGSTKKMGFVGEEVWETYKTY